MLRRKNYQFQPAPISHSVIRVACLLPLSLSKLDHSATHHLPTHCIYTHRTVLKPYGATSLHGIQQLSLFNRHYVVTGRHKLNRSTSAFICKLLRPVVSTQDIGFHGAFLSSSKLLRRILPSSGLLRGVRRFETDVSRLSAQSSRVKIPSSSPETSVSNHITPRNCPENGIIQFNRAERLRSRTV